MAWQAREAGLPVADPAIQEPSAKRQRKEKVLGPAQVLRRRLGLCSKNADHMVCSGPPVSARIILTVGLG